jgi:hypothetical protein
MPDFRLPGDLSKLTRAELAQLKADAQAEVNAILERDTSEQPFTMTEAARIRELTTAGKTLTERDTELASAETADAAEIDAAMAEARDVFAAANTVPDGEGTDDGGETPAVPETPEVLTGELVTASGRNKAVTSTPLKKPTLNASLRNASLREAAAKQGLTLATPAAPELEISAFADIPGFAMNQRFGSNTAVADAFIARARALPPTRNAPNYVGVASIKNSFDTVLNDRTPAADVEAAIKRMTDSSALWGDDGITTAGGGWCTPPVNRYAFFDMSCEDGGIDLPTMGIERGGINFPTSPSLADVFTGEFTNGTNPWLWTETDDILTVTGSVNKPCVRVPCPAFTPVRLECYGICLTAGNLTDNAYPEATQHQISLLNSALFHASNTRYIQQMVNLSTTIVTGGQGGAGVISPVLYMVELAAEDYRTRFGMCQTEVLEVVLPHWIIAAMRADATKRTGVDMVGITDNMIADWFDMRHVRAQFVSDWQVRTTGLPGFTTAGAGFNSWPTTVDFMIYAAGTFIRGNGMTLNLGVVRDSTLNAENDHTALWMEECHLIARFGPQSRQYRVNICADGTTGANDLVLCTP